MDIFFVLATKKKSLEKQTHMATKKHNKTTYNINRLNEQMIQSHGLDSENPIGIIVIDKILNNRVTTGSYDQIHEY